MGFFVFELRYVEVWEGFAGKDWGSKSDDLGYFRQGVRLELLY